MQINNAVVEAISRKEVTTKRGPASTFSIKLRGGDWYSCGFTDPKVGKEDVVSFDYEESTYGKQITPKTLTKGGIAGGASERVTSSSAAPDTPRPAYGNKGVFPIPALDGTRSIVRQNALTNARELLGIRLTALSKTEMTRYPNEELSDAVIKLARKFEAYTAGDLDMEEAQREFNDSAS